MSNLPCDAKHPIMLPKKHHISKLAITHIHNQSHHNFRVNFTLAELCQKYWIVNGREETKQRKRECNVCKLGRRHGGHQFIAPLPEARLCTPLRCFAHCGVGFAGPFVIMLIRKVTVKRYLWLFTCVSTQAVLLEIASSRMTARHGKPEVVISDNGTNFTPAERELHDL